VTLSVCCATGDPAAQVAAILEPLREVADEVVVAVDSRLDPDLLGRYADAADRLFRFEFAVPNERIWGWMQAQCSSDWVLRLDGDELVSSAAVARLPELMGARDAFQYWLPCRWLYPDGRHWLDQPPWGYDNNKLLRNDPATTWFPGMSHLHVAPTFPSTYLREGYYHFDYLLRSRVQREAKLTYYLDRVPPELKLGGSDIDMRRYYLPEEFGGLNTVAVDPRDIDLIDAVLRAEGDEMPTAEGLTVPLATRAEIDALWPERPWEAEAYRASITPLDPPIRLTPREHRPVVVRIRNEGTETWPWGEPTSPRLGYWPSVEHHPLIRLVHRWLQRDGAMTVAGDQYTPLPVYLRPGESIVVPVLTVAPGEPGDYLLEIDLAHGARPFDCPGYIDALVTSAS
jgi:hypothetical protein